jgi:aromatic ring-cleaving dioxygenase
MRRTIIGLLIVAGAIALGVGGAYGVSRLVTDSPDLPRVRDNLNTRYMPGWDNRLPGGMMGRQGFYGHMDRGGYGYQQSDNATRLTIDEAQNQAEEYAQKVGENLKVTEVMEFSNNFYAVVIETDTNKGAFELLIDPYTGQTGLEMGAGMMWNQKYGRMNVAANPSPDNTLTMEQAATAAQEALDNRIPGATLESDGIDFYGYYSFDYKVDGEVAGMLSVNGDSGRVIFHTWHSDFISEKEID